MITSKTPHAKYIATGTEAGPLSQFVLAWITTIHLSTEAMNKQTVDTMIIIKEILCFKSPLSFDKPLTIL